MKKIVVLCCVFVSLFFCLTSIADGQCTIPPLGYPPNSDICTFVNFDICAKASFDLTDQEINDATKNNRKIINAAELACGEYEKGDPTKYSFCKKDYMRKLSELDQEGGYKEVFHKTYFEIIKSAWDSLDSNEKNTICAYYENKPEYFKKCKNDISYLFKEKLALGDKGWNWLFNIDKMSKEEPYYYFKQALKCKLEESTKIVNCWLQKCAAAYLKDIQLTNVDWDTIPKAKGIIDLKVDGKPIDITYKENLPKDFDFSTNISIPIRKYKVPLSKIPYQMSNEDFVFRFNKSNTSIASAGGTDYYTWFYKGSDCELNDNYLECYLEIPFQLLYNSTIKNLPDSLSFVVQAVPVEYMNSIEKRLNKLFPFFLASENPFINYSSSLLFYVPNIKKTVSDEYNFTALIMDQNKEKTCQLQTDQDNDGTCDEFDVDVDGDGKINILDEDTNSLAKVFPKTPAAAAPNGQNAPAPAASGKAEYEMKKGFGDPRSQTYQFTEKIPTLEQYLASSKSNPPAAAEQQAPLAKEELKSRIAETTDRSSDSGAKAETSPKPAEGDGGFCAMIPNAAFNPSSLLLILIGLGAIAGKRMNK